MYIHEPCGRELVQTGLTWICPECAIQGQAIIKRLEGERYFIELIYTMPVMKSLAEALGREKVA